MQIKFGCFNYYVWNVLISFFDFYYIFEESFDFRYCIEVIDFYVIVLIDEDR